MAGRVDRRWALAAACLAVCALAAAPVLAIGKSWLVDVEPARGWLHAAGFAVPVPLSTAGFLAFRAWDRALQGGRHASSPVAVAAFLLATVAMLGGLAVAYVQALNLLSDG